MRGKPVGAGRAKAKRAGTVTVRVRIAKKQAFRRAARVALKVRFAPAGGGRVQTTRTTLRLKAAAAAANAAARGWRSAKFVAYVSGRQVTRWKIDRHGTHGNCQGEYTTGGEGRETVRFQTKPMRVLVYRTGSGNAQMKRAASSGRAGSSTG